MAVQKIKIVIETMVKGLENLKYVTKRTKELTRQQVVINKTMSAGASQMLHNAKNINSLGKQYDSFGGVMRMPMENWKKFNKEGGEFDTIGGRAGNRFRMMTHGLRGFKMEMLSVMFFGMMLQRTFMGMLKPAMEVFGVFDIFRIMLMVLFIPIIQRLFPIFMKIVNWFITLGDEIKLAIGIFVILGAIVGTFLFIFGSVVLGIGGMIVAFGPLGTIALPIILSIIAVIAGLALIVTGVVMIIKGKLEGIGLVIMGIGVILFLFIGWWALIPIAVGVAVYLIIKHWDKFKLFFSLLWTHLKIIVLKAIKGWIDAQMIFIRLMAKIPLVGKVFKPLIGTIDKVTDGLDGMIENLEKVIKTKKAVYAVGQAIKAMEEGVEKTTESSTGGLLGFLPGVPGGILPEGLGELRPTMAPGGETTTIPYSPTYNITVSDKAEFERLLAEHDSKLLSQIERNK